MHNAPPKVSIIIPCYNYGEYLAQALQSVLEQDYPQIEIIVVDDGSTDNTPLVAKNFPGVIYTYQENAGPAAARNTGVKASTGDFLLFLDADDELVEGALKLQVDLLQKNREAWFAAGGHYMMDAKGEILDRVSTEISENFFLHMLRTNFIGMHAAVMYRRIVFDSYAFDPVLRTSDEYELYLKISYNHPIIIHKAPIALYRKHNSNISGNLPRMLKDVLQVLSRQRPFLKTDDQKKAYRQGRFNWIYFYGHKMMEQLIAGMLDPKYRRRVISCLLAHRPQFYIKFLIHKILNYQNVTQKIPA